MHRVDKTMCATFLLLCLFSTWGILYAFWLSFETFPVDSRIWDAKLDQVSTLPCASLFVFQDGEATHVCVQTMCGRDSIAFAANSSAFNECTLLGTLVYLQGDKGGLCLAFQTKALVDAFLSSIGLKDLAEFAALDEAGSSDDASTSGYATPEDEDEDDDDDVDVDVSVSALSEEEGTAFDVEDAANVYVDTD